MAVAHIRRWVAVVVLACLALCATLGSGQGAKRPPLVLLAINGNDTEVLVPQRDDGGFSDADLQRAALAFSHQSPRMRAARPKAARKVHPLSPRLLDLVYRTMRHFDARVVRLVSGFRRDRAGSRHTQGRAVDMTIEGVANDELAKYVREFGFVGVGFYSKSGFVHLDVRDASYFWIDDSAPGAVCHLMPVLADDARRADAAARARGEKPDVYVPNNIDEDIAAANVYAHRARDRRAAARNPRSTKGAAAQSSAAKRAQTATNPRAPAR